jgi:hypothetical protein
VGPRCSFCGSSTGPFREVGGLFPLSMCDTCRAVRAAPAPEPDVLIAYPDLREPDLQWSCPIAGCDHRGEVFWDLEDHAPAAHPGWTARLEEHPLRVTYRRQSREP